MWNKGVLDYDLGFCCFKEVKTTAKILIILAFKPEIHQNMNPKVNTCKYNFGLIIYAWLRTLSPNS